MDSMKIYREIAVATAKPSAAQRAEIEHKLRAIDGVVSVSNHDARPHLSIIEYDPNKVASSALLDTVRRENVHAEMIGL